MELKMHRTSWLKAGLVSLTILPCVAIAQPVKKKEVVKDMPIEGFLGGDQTARNAVITWLHKGTLGLCSQTEGPVNEPKFRIGLGESDNRPCGLCGQSQYVQWDVRALYDRNTGRTKWWRKSDINEVGFLLARVSLSASEEKRDSLAQISMIAGTFKTGGTARIGEKVAKDDAFVGGSGVSYSEAASGFSYTLDGSPILSVETRLWGVSGGSASITEQGGLVLFAEPGQVVGFRASGIHAFDPDRSFSWTAILNGDDLFVVGASQNDFIQIAGGYRLPYSMMPGHDLTANFSSGDLEQRTYVTAYMAAPEPASMLGLAGAGMFLVNRFRRRKRRSLKAS